jgi:galactokinase
VLQCETGRQFVRLWCTLTDFRSVFGAAPACTASAPGRVNLIGEHTDYNGGFVLPIALPLRTHVQIALRDDHRVRAYSASVAPEQANTGYVRGAERRTGDWIDYVQGVTQALDRRRQAVPGFNLFVESDVPVGSGLASSAALEVAVLRALREACALSLSDVDLAIVAHRAETDLVGAPVGIMDQMAASLADDRQALFLDTMSLDMRRVAMPPRSALAIIDSGITHDHASGEYRVRRAECAQAAALLGVDRLRALSADDLPRIAQLPPPLDRRVRHVVTENARVLAAIAAMQAGDMAALGQIWMASHLSMRDDFETSLPEIDALVAMAGAERGVYGARLTGGGFGGAVIVLCDADAAAPAARRIRLRYQTTTTRPARVLLPINPS